MSSSSQHPKVRRIEVSQPLVRTGCTLGEGPLYDHATATLHFVDILESKVYHMNTKTLELRHVQLPEAVTCLALRRGGKGLACATASGIAFLHGSTLEYICQPIPPEQRPFIRFNDGACDSKGRFFIGSVYSKEHNLPGLLHRYDPADGTCTIVDAGPFTDSNGIGWSPDEKKMYFTDSRKNIIYAYDYDNGELSNRRVFIDALAQGLPEDSFCDGLCIDSEGCIWSARWGGSRVCRFTTEGILDLEIYIPKAYHVTACCFGGPSEDKLYITTASPSAFGGNADLQKQYPLSGDLFMVDLAGQFQGGTWRYEFGL